MSDDKLIKLLTVIQAGAGGGVVSALWITGHLEFWLSVFVLVTSLAQWMGARND